MRFNDVLRRFTVCGVAAAAAVVLVGCGSDTAEPAAPAQGDSQTQAETTEPAEVLTASNTACPKTGRAVSASVETVSHNGQAIGFCCNGCRASWSSMSDAERDATLGGGA